MPGPVGERQPGNGGDNRLRRAVDQIGQGIKKHGSELVRDGALIVTAANFAGGGPVANPNRLGAQRKDNGNTPAGLMAKNTLRGVSVTHDNGGNDKPPAQVSSTSTTPGFDRSDTRGQNLIPANQTKNDTQTAPHTSFDGSYNRGPNSAQIAKERSTPNPDWGNPQVIQKGKSRVGQTGVNTVLEDLGTVATEVAETAGGVGGVAFDWLENSRPILAACSVLPGVTPVEPTAAPTEVKPNPTAYPTLTPDSTLSDSKLSNNLVAYLKSGNIGVAPTPDVDEQFVAGYMGITGVALLQRFPGTDISEFNVRMPINRTLLDAWEASGSPPTTIISYGQEQYTLAGIKIGNKFDWRIEKLSSDSKGIGFTTDGSSIIRQGIGENSFTDKKQADQIWDKATGMWYDGSNLPSDLHGVDITSARDAFAPQLATASRSIYNQNPDVSLSELASIKNDGSVSWVITGDDGQVRYADNKGQVTQPPRTPKDMRARIDDQGNLVWQRQTGPDVTSPWQTINIFNPTTGQMENADQQSATPTATSTQTEAPTVTPTPDILSGFPAGTTISKTVDGGGVIIWTNPADTSQTEILGTMGKDGTVVPNPYVWVSSKDGQFAVLLTDPIMDGSTTGSQKYAPVDVPGVMMGEARNIKGDIWVQVKFPGGKTGWVKAQDKAGVKYIDLSPAAQNLVTKALANPEPTATATVTPDLRAPSLDSIKPIFSTDFSGEDAGFSYAPPQQSEGGNGRNATGSHYDYPDDPTGTGHGKVYRGIVDGLSPFKNEVFRPYPADYFNFVPGNYSTGVKVYMYDTLEPSTIFQAIGPGLSLITLFDGGWGTFHPSVLVNVEGEQGNYRLFTAPIDSQGKSKNVAANVPFPTQQWVEIRVDVDVKSNAVKTYQDGVLISTAPYVAEGKGVAGVHWGLYGSKLTKATLLNDDAWLRAGY